MQKRTAAVLIIGLEPDHFKAFRRRVGIGVTAGDASLELDVTASESLSLAADLVRQTRELGVVYVTNEVGHSMHDMLVGAGQLALTLASHERRPMVVLSGELGYLRPVFESMGVGVVIHIALERAIVYRYRKVTVGAG